MQKRVSSRFSCLAPGIERFSLDLPWAIKKNLPWMWGEGVCGICDHRQKKFFYSVILIWGKQWEILIVGINKCCLWWCRLLNLNPGAWGEHFTHQLPCVNAWLLHTCLPCLPSRWVSPYVLCPLWLGYWGFCWRFLHEDYGFSSVGVGAVLGNESGILGQHYVALL